MNIRDRRDILNSADQSLANAKGDPKKILLIYLSIITGLSLAVAVISILLSNRIADTGGLGNMGLRSILSTAKSVLPMVQSVILLGLEMGYCTMALNITRGERISNDTLFGGFRRFFPLLRAQILLSFLYLGLGLLAVYPGAYIFLMLPISEGFYEAFTPVMESASQLTGTLTIDEATMAVLSEAMQPALWIMATLFLLHRQVILLSAEEGEARMLGVNVGVLRLIVLLIATLVVSAVVSLTGLISFVSLLAPHGARLLTKHNRIGTMFLSGLTGGVLLCCADILARSVAATELPVSIFTSILGAPFLIFLIVRGRKQR